MGWTHDRGRPIDPSDAAAHSLKKRWRGDWAQMAERLQAPARPRLLPAAADHHAGPSTAAVRRPDRAACAARPLPRAPQTHPLAGGPETLQGDGRAAGVVAPVLSWRSRHCPQIRSIPDHLAAGRCPHLLGIAADTGPPPALQPGARPRRGGGGASLLQGGQVVEAATGRCRFRMRCSAQPGACRPELGHGASDRPPGPDAAPAPLPVSGRARAVAQKRFIQRHRSLGASSWP